MNICLLSGRVQNASIKGSDPVVLSFIVETVSGGGNEKKDLVSCVIFNPDEALASQLTERGEPLYVELEGRVSSSSLKTNGERRYNTDVRVRSFSFRIVNPAEP